MVVTCLPPRSDTCTLHERVGSPLICTVQAPHWAMPHPNFVPVGLRCSRSTQRSGVSGSASTLTALPLTVNAVATMPSSGNADVPHKVDDFGVSDDPLGRDVGDLASRPTRCHGWACENPL